VLFGDIFVPFCALLWLSRVFSLRWNKCACPLFFLIEQKDAKDAKRRDLCDLRDLLLRILEQKGIAVPERRFAASGLLAFLNEAKK